MTSVFIRYLAFLLLFGSSCPAAEPPASYAFATVSRSGRCLFKMVPEQTEKNVEAGALKPARGEAFEIQPDGGLKSLWSVSGWYARQLYLSDDGRTLVRIEPLHQGGSLSKTDTALAFYYDGVLVREYHTIDLVKQAGQVRTSPQGYVWLAPSWVAIADSKGADGTTKVGRDPDAEPMLDNAGIFKVKTIDRILYLFEASTGKLLKRTMP